MLSDILINMAKENRGIKNVLYCVGLFFLKNLYETCERLTGVEEFKFDQGMMITIFLRIPEKDSMNVLLLERNLSLEQEKQIINTLGELSTTIWELFPDGISKPSITLDHIYTLGQKIDKLRGTKRSTIAVWGSILVLFMQRKRPEMTMTGEEENADMYSQMYSKLPLILYHTYMLSDILIKMAKENGGDDDSNISPNSWKRFIECASIKRNISLEQEKQLINTLGELSTTIWELFPDGISKPPIILNHIYTLGQKIDKLRGTKRCTIAVWESILVLFL